MGDSGALVLGLHARDGVGRRAAQDRVDGRPLPAAARARRADHRHVVRRREAAEVRASDLHAPTGVHLHHRFVNIGFSQRRAALTMWAWCATLGGRRARDPVRAVPRGRPLAPVGNASPSPRSRLAALAFSRLRRLPARDRQAREPARPPRGATQALATTSGGARDGAAAAAPSPSSSPTSRARRSCSSGSVTATPTVVAEHRRIIRDAFAARGGKEIDTQGDAFFFSFARARDAVAAAVAAQRALAEHAWPDGSSAPRAHEPPHRRARRRRGGLRRDRRRPRRPDLRGGARRAGAALGDDRRARVGGGLPDGVSKRDLGR